MTGPINDQTARVLRAAWFDYLDTIEPIRPRLHAYCLRLAGSVWEAEDLVQDTLLRGFGTVGRGDMHGEHSRFERPQAYLSQIATNLWIDRWRRARRDAGLTTPEPLARPADPAVLTTAAAAALFERVSPQERAAVVLREVFDFTANEIAEVLVTTPGAVKAALRRGREKLDQARLSPTPRNNVVSAELLDRFIAAFNARDVPGMVALLLESAVYEPLGVGGERGRDTIWLKVPTPDDVVAEAHVVDGERVMAFTATVGGRKRLGCIDRLEEAEGRISRIITYYFCPDTLAAVADRLGLVAAPHGYHQDAGTLSRMIADTAIPWRGLG